MDQARIGRFIAECRKQQKLTQAQLAERLGITDRAVSKWETGRAMPDSSIMLELCDILKITVNDLLSGEVVAVDNYSRELENNLMEMVRQKEQSDRRLLNLEVFIGVTGVVTLLVLIFIAAYVQMADWVRIVLIAFGFIVFLAGCFAALRIEQVAGYYECRVCRHRYVPNYLAVNKAMHMGRTRYMKCPVCGKRSWQKKVLNKE